MAPRIEVDDAQRKMQAGEDLLVCAYDDDEKFGQNHLDGAISLKEFKAMEPTLAKDREIVFYCA